MSLTFALEAIRAYLTDQCSSSGLSLPLVLGALTPHPGLLLELHLWGPRGFDCALGFLQKSSKLAHFWVRCRSGRSSSSRRHFEAQARAVSCCAWGLIASWTS